MSQETKEKISKANKGKKRTKVQCLRMSYSQQDIPKSGSHKEKISKALSKREIGKKQIEGLFLAKKGVVLPSLKERMTSADQRSIQKLKSDPFK